MSIKLVGQLFVLVSWVLLLFGREKERLPGTYGLPLWRVTELGSFHHHGTYFSLHPFPSHCLLPILAGHCVTLGKGSTEKQKESYVEERGWETCQYERKEAFRISAMVASHLKLGEAASNSGFTAQFQKREGWRKQRQHLAPVPGRCFSCSWAASFIFISH